MAAFESFPLKEPILGVLAIRFGDRLFPDLPRENRSTASSPGFSDSPFKLWDGKWICKKEKLVGSGQWFIPWPKKNSKILRF